MNTQLNMGSRQSSSTAVPPPPYELRLPSFMDATLAFPAFEPPRSVSYLLSMQDALRYPTDSAASPSHPDLRTELSQLVSSSSSAVDQDRTLVQTISEYDRATLLPIIRIAFPAVRCSVQDSLTQWHNAADDQIAGTMDKDGHVSQMEGLYYQSIDMEDPKHEIGLQESQYDLISTVPSTIVGRHRCTGVYGVLSEEELRPWPVDVGARPDNVEKLESVVVMDEMRIQRQEPGVPNTRDDNLSPSTASRGGGLIFVTSFTGGYSSPAHMVPDASRTTWVLQQVAAPVVESNELVHGGQLSCGTSCVHSGNSHSETMRPKCSEAVNEIYGSQTVEASQAQLNCNSAQIVASERVDRTSFATESDLARPSSALDDEEKYLARESRGLGTLSVSKFEDLRFPEISRKRRNVIKKAVGWLRKKRSQSLSARVSHKHKCGLVCCTGCEPESKRRRISSYSSRGITGGTLFPIRPQVRPLTRGSKRSNEEGKFDRKSYMNPPCNTDTCGTAGNLLAMPAKATSPVGKKASHYIQEQVNSPLSAGLFVLLSQPGSHGLTVCEALRKLLKQGYSNLFDSSSQPRAIQVKMAFRRCSDFKQLKSCRFIVKKNRMIVDKKMNVKSGSCEQKISAAGNARQEKGTPVKGIFKKPWTTGRYSEYVTQKFSACSTAERRCHGQEQRFEQCHKTDGKQWQCSQQAKLGFLYCEHHHQGQSKARVKILSSRKNYHSDIVGQTLQLSDEQRSRTAADGNSCRSRESWQGEEFKLRRCHRTDGRHWQCSKLALSGSSYCEHHQGQRKKGMPRGWVPGQITAARKAKQDVQVEQIVAIDSIVTGVKAQIKASVQSQKSIAKKAMRPSKACTENRSQTDRKRKAKGKVLGQTAAAKESKQKLHVSDLCSVAKSHCVARAALKQRKGNGHVHTKVIQKEKQQHTGLKSCTVVRDKTAAHCWRNGNANLHEQAYVEGPIEMSESADNIWHGKMEASHHGQISEERYGSQAVLAVDYSSLARSSTSIYFPAKRSAAVPGKNGQQLERCHRKDGKRWQCSQHCKPGYIYCDHHQECRHKRKAVRGGQEKSITEKTLKKPVMACVEGFSHLNGEGCSANQTNLLREVERIEKEIPHVARECSWSATSVCDDVGEVPQLRLKRCHRTDGKGWQCPRQAKQGFVYCEHHQTYLRRRTTSKLSSK